MIFSMSLVPWQVRVQTGRLAIGPGRAEEENKKLRGTGLVREGFLEEVHWELSVFKAEAQRKGIFQKAKQLL